MGGTIGGCEVIKSLKISEAEFTHMVIELARLRGWLVAHFRPAKTSKGWRTAVSGDGAGFPDLILVRGSKVLVAELKVGKNKVAINQGAWLHSFERAGIPAYVWRETDWQRIEKLLA